MVVNFFIVNMTIVCGEFDIGSTDSAFTRAHFATFTSSYLEHKKAQNTCNKKQTVDRLKNKMVKKFLKNETVMTKRFFAISQNLQNSVGIPSKQMDHCGAYFAPPAGFKCLRSSSKSYL